MKIKKIISSAMITALAAASLQAAQPPVAKAGGLDGILGSFVVDVLDADEEGIQKTYKSMVDNYYAAAYYSNRAAIIGSELLRNLRTGLVYLKRLLTFLVRLMMKHLEKSKTKKAG